MKIGERIKRLREAQNLTQQELAERVGYKTSSAINKIELGLRDVSQSKIIAFAQALGSSPEQLMGWEQKEIEDAPGSFPYKPTHRIPLLGRVRAGLPLYAEENLEGYISTDLNGGAEYFGLRVVGDSMNAARIVEGDIVIVRKQDVVENGEIAIVLIDNEDATIKKFMRYGNTVHLIPMSTNPQYQIQEYDLDDTKVRILGKVVCVQYYM